MTGRNPFEDFLTSQSQRPPAAAPKPERGVQIRGREIDGTFYVRVEDVVALLTANQVLPKATAQLERRCAK